MGTFRLSLNHRLNAAGFSFRRMMQGDTVMEPLAIVARLASAIREFFVPRYRPELYYMRGPGPASRRAGMIGQRIPR